MTSCYFGDGGWCFACGSCCHCRCCCCYCCRCMCACDSTILFVVYLKYTIVWIQQFADEERRNHNSKCLRFLSIKTQGEKFVHLIISFLVCKVLPHILLCSPFCGHALCVSAVSYFSFIHSNISVASVWMHRSMSLQFIAEIQIGRRKSDRPLVFGELKNHNARNSNKTHHRTPTMTRMKWLRQWQRPVWNKTHPKIQIQIHNFIMFGILFIRQTANTHNRLCSVMMRMKFICFHSVFGLKRAFNTNWSLSQSMNTMSIFVSFEEKNQTINGWLNGREISIQFNAQPKTSRV